MENYMREFLRLTWNGNKTNITSIDDFLLTHDAAWITEEEFEFHHNKTIGNSNITTTSYTPVVWDKSLLVQYKKSVGLSTNEKQILYFDITSCHSYTDTFVRNATVNLDNASTGAIPCNSSNVTPFTPSYSVNNTSFIQGKSPVEMLFESLQYDHHATSTTSVFGPVGGGTYLHGDSAAQQEELVQHKVGTTEQLTIGPDDEQNLLDNKENRSKADIHQCTCTGEVVGESASANGRGKVHQCRKCGKVMDGITEFNRHMLIHTGEKPFVCQECGKRFNQTQHLNQHFLRHRGYGKGSCLSELPRLQLVTEQNRGNEREPLPILLPSLDELPKLQPLQCPMIVEM